MLYFFGVLFVPMFLASFNVRSNCGIPKIDGVRILMKVKGFKDLLLHKTSQKTMQ